MAAASSGRPEQVSLTESTTESPENPVLGLLLDPLRDGGVPESLGHADDCVHEGDGFVLVGEGRDERTVDLQDVDGEPLEVGDEE